MEVKEELRLKHRRTVGPKMENQQVDLCDVCRQHRAIHRFVEADMVRPRDRQVCATCFTGYHATPASALIDINKVIYAQGKCEKCGGRPFSISGIPGPDRRVLCYECAERKDENDSAEG